MLHQVPKENLRIGCDLEEYLHLKDLENRELYLVREINPLCAEDSANMFLSTVNYIIKHIIEFNAQDKGLDPSQRQPIKLFINSPGGSVSEGFPLVSTIELSKTPVHTVNIGTWSSMAFCIGIAGHKRFALPYTKFLLHEGSTFAGGASGRLRKRYKDEVIKKHVLEHSKMTEQEYASLLRCEYYMLPQDALKHGFIDDIVTDIDAIL